MKINNTLKTFILLSAIIVIICTVGARVVSSQTWQALPPYNFLWPLWSPALSPGGIPLASNLYPSTILPFQPGLAWNPAISYPYFLYNSPVGMQYYDVIYGINAWPPSYVIDPTTLGPLPISLPLGYNLLPPTDPLWIQQNLPTANLAYLAQYPALALGAYNLVLPPNLTGLNPWLASLIYPTPSFASLLTVADILGY